jgi:hypothetical protein
MEIFMVMYWECRGSHRTGGQMGSIRRQEAHRIRAAQHDGAKHMPVMPTMPEQMPKKKPGRRLLVVFGLQDLATTVETVRADVVTQVRFAGGWLDCQVWCNQEVVRTVHTALRWGFFILLNSHDNS